MGELLGNAGLFTVRVVLGRILWTVVAGIVVFAWVSYQHPKNPISKCDIRTLAKIQNAEGHDWIPSRDRLEKGFVLIVHGLWGGIENYKGGSFDALGAAHGERHSNKVSAKPAGHRNS